MNHLKKITKEKMKNHDSGHDFLHTMRVYKIAEKIGKRENADLSELLPAALLHDIKKSSKKTEELRQSSANESAKIAEKILKDLSFPEDKIKKILYCIKTHSFSRGIVPDSMEAKILQDADRLDALGAVGIARAFSVGEEMKIPMYHETDPFAENRNLDDYGNSLDHFYIKLLKLKDGMHTETARKIAEKRHRFMLDYLKRLKKEILC